MTEQEKDDTVLGCFAIFMVIVFLLMFAAYVAVADAHEWYPAACCSDLDCRPVPCEEIHSVGDKWEWRHFSIEKFKTQMSPDGKCHVCPLVSGSTLICIFMGGTS